MQAFIPHTIPPYKHEVLRNAVDALAALDGVVAVVLGGSYARETHHENSDLDLGVYYTESSPFSIEAIRSVAMQLSNGPPPVVTNFYEWGPWVNGGAWIHTAAGKIDFLYRNLEQVERTIQDARQGVHHHHYNQQPTFGFYSVIYLAETQVCIPLFDPHAHLVRLKQQVASYPPKLKHAMVKDSLWGAEFTFLSARKFADGGDIYNTVGCLSRIAGYMTQALCALNETYFISDKGALAATRRFACCPPNYEERVSRVFASPGAEPAQLTRTVHILEALWQEMVDLAGYLYTPKYPLP